MMRKSLIKNVCKCMAIILTLGLMTVPVDAHTEENPCIRSTKYDIVPENDLDGLIQLAIQQESSSQAHMINLLENEDHDSITVEQVIEEKEYADGSIEKTIAQSLIAIIDSETKQPVTRSQLQNQYPVTLSSEFSATQTIYATGLFMDGLISKARCDKITMIVYSAPSSVVRATQRLRIRGVAVVATGGGVDTSQSITSPGYGQVYTLVSPNTNWYNVGNMNSMYITANIDVLLINGHGGKSEYSILDGFNNPPYIQYY